MKLSIAMTSYNGARFIGEQLESFANQTRLPDELLVADDRSTDGTPEILRDFQRRSPFPVRMIDNEHRLGFVKNFERAVRECSGDVIFLSDHDDRWDPEKLAEHEAVYASQPSVGFVFSNATFCDESLNPLGTTAFERLGLRPNRLPKIQRGKLLDFVIRTPRVAGCQMSFRSGLREIVLPFSEACIHDVWLGSLLPMFTESRCIARPLMAYRTHATQTIGIHQPGFEKEGFVDSYIRACSDLLDRFRRFESVAYRKDAARMLERKLAHLRARSKVEGPLPWRVLVFGGEVLNGNYWRFSTKSSVMYDVKKCFSLR